MGAYPFAGSSFPASRELQRQGRPDPSDFEEEQLQPDSHGFERMLGKLLQVIARDIQESLKVPPHQWPDMPWFQEASRLPYSSGIDVEAKS